LAGLRAALPPSVRVEAAPGVQARNRLQPPYAGDDLEIQRAVTLAAAADVAVVVVGNTEETQSEGHDRSSLVLSGRQDELVRRVADANPRTVVVVNAGAPVLLPWRHLVPAVLLAWFPGQEFGTALADVLLGVVEPGGRLPTTWPQDETGLPSTTPVDGVLRHEEGLHVGYRRFLRDQREPAYWFGHGLGYSEWEYGSTVVLGADETDSADSAEGAGDDTGDPEFTVRVRLRNSGARPGRQVVQVYLARPDSSIERPLRWLAGYAGVRAEPGEKTTAVIAVPRRAFAHWDVGTHGWVVEPGEFELSVGRSVVDLIASTTVTPRPD
jgi:beta-glucosidase